MAESSSISEGGFPFRIALIGDIHTCWSSFDTGTFNRSDYDLILICGDLPGRLHRHTLDIARDLAELRRPTLMIPGNHDATTSRQNLGEILHDERLIGESGEGQSLRVRELAEALGPVTLGGYSLHRFGPFDVVCLRPHSIGGPSLAFRPYLSSAFGVDTLEDSARRIMRLIDECQRDIILFGHNGPTGLGADRASIFGCDFRPEMGDFGDPDARQALDYALSQGKRIRAVLAGHMHHAIRGGGSRTWHVQEQGIAFVNAARVPRISSDSDGRFRHHHVRIELTETDVSLSEVFATPGE